MTWMHSKDGAGNIIRPGDLCVRSTRNGHPEYCIFVGSVWGGKASGGEYGRFLTPSGFTSIKYSNSLLAFDPMSERKAEKGIKDLVRRFYEKGDK